MNELDRDGNGFFMRRLALRADARLLLIGVRFMTGAAGSRCRAAGAGLDGLDLKERLSSNF